MFRQGDVLIIPVASLPTGLTEETRDAQGRIVLAHGEVTGHCHAIHEKHVRLFRAADDGAMAPDRYLEILGAPAVLRHEEHTHHTIEAGKYRVVIQREYSPEGLRNVED